MFSRNHKHTVFVAIILALAIGFISYDPWDWFSKTNYSKKTINNAQQHKVVVTKSIPVKHLTDYRIALAPDNIIKPGAFKSLHSTSTHIEKENAKSSDTTTDRNTADHNTSDHDASDHDATDTTTDTTSDDDE
ncbi:MAG: hypothetical protein ACD_58C00033G0002 [uncultured bacterium]|nr:MAG: hypothetical protein ACD_58C00033G0002 [uncultured bacterium]